MTILLASFLPASDAVNPTHEENFPRILMPEQDKELLVIKYVDGVGLWLASRGGCYYRGKPGVEHSSESALAAGVQTLVIFM
jgi:hypothetical protein